MSEVQRGQRAGAKARSRAVDGFRGGHRERLRPISSLDKFVADLGHRIRQRASHLQRRRRAPAGARGPDLVERARTGDVVAFEALVGGRIEAMVRIAMAIIGDESEAREATQETLTTIWRELPSLRDAERFDAWTGRILVNRARLTLIRRSRRGRAEVEMPQPDGAGVPSRSGFEDRLVRRAALESAFERLDSDARTLLVLHHLDGLPVVEIAAWLNVPVGTAKSRLHAARRALERELEPDA